MKRIFTLMFVLAAAFCGFAQDRNNEDEVVKIDFMNRYNAVEGEVIVKFADNSSFRLDYDRNDNLRTTGMSSVDKAFEKFNVTSIKQLCPSDEKKRTFRTSKSYNGADVVERDLSRLCLVKIEPDASRAQDADYNIQALTQELIDTFNAMEDVEFAEPNFIMYALGVETTDNGRHTTPSTSSGTIVSVTEPVEVTIAFDKLRHHKTAKSFWISAVVMFILFSMPYIPKTGNISVNGIYELACIILVFPLIVWFGASGKPTGKFSMKACKLLGDISYPLYIVHYPVMYLFYSWLIDNELYTLGETWHIVLLVMATNIALAYICLKLYDEPIRRTLKF